MSKVFVNVGMPLDGYMAQDGMDVDHAFDPEYLGWADKWSGMRNWLLQQQYFQQRLGLGDGGETGADNDMVRRTFERTGVSIRASGCPN